MPKRKTTDGDEHRAHVLFTKMTCVELSDGVIHTRGQSRDYERSSTLTIACAQQLYAMLGRCLAEAGIDTGMRVDRVTFTRTGEGVRFDIGYEGEAVGNGIVTPNGMADAMNGLQEQLGTRKVVAIKR